MLTCERVTDLLPEFAARSLDHANVVAVRAHIDGCAACADELMLVQTLRDASPVAPAAMADRISEAVVYSANARRTARPWGYRHLAAAATIAVALIGGAIAVDQFERDTGRSLADLSGDPAAAVSPPSGDARIAVQTDEPRSAAGTDTGAAREPVAGATNATATYTPVSAPLLGNGSVLAELTAAELEALIEEMDS